MKHPLRVAMVAPFFVTGGAENCMFRLARHLRSVGHEVDFIATDTPGEWFSLIREMGFKAEHISGHDGKMRIRHMLNVGRVLEREARDVIFLNQSRYAQSAIRRVPDRAIIIPILHSDTDSVYKISLGNSEAWNVAVAVSPKVLKRARREAPGRPVVEIPYGVDLPDPERLAQREDFKGPPVKLAFIGRLTHAQKGIWFLPEILRGIINRGVDARLVVAGDGPDRKELEERISRCRVQDRVELRGPVDTKKAYEILLGSAMLLMPSFFEGLPIISLEAQACGCVPIASDIPDTTDAAVIQGKTGILVPVGGIEQFADAVVSLASNPERWRAMSVAGRERVRSGFSAQAMGEKYSDLIQRALSGEFPLPRPRRRLFKLDPGLLTWTDFLPYRLRRKAGDMLRSSRYFAANRRHRIQ